MSSSSFQDYANVSQAIYDPKTVYHLNDNGADASHVIFLLLCFCCETTPIFSLKPRHDRLLGIQCSIGTDS
jgi:hypothetical protein